MEELEAEDAAGPVSTPDGKIVDVRVDLSPEDAPSTANPLATTQMVIFTVSSVMFGHVGSRSCGGVGPRVHSASAVGSCVCTATKHVLR